MTPRLEALAFRMWAYCTPLEWNCSARDVAEALGVSYQQIGHVLRIKGWTGRLRGSQITPYAWDRMAHKAPARISADLRLSDGEALQ